MMSLLKPMISGNCVRIDMFASNAETDSQTKYQSWPQLIECKTAPYYESTQPHGNLVTDPSAKIFPIGHWSIVLALTLLSLGLLLVSKPRKNHGPCFTPGKAQGARQFEEAGTRAADPSSLTFS
jgi:hypothetical protein